MIRYEKYSDIGILGMPQTPSHWNKVRNKSFLKVVGVQVGDRRNEYPLLSLTTKGIILRDIESGKGKFPKDFDTYQIVKKDDLVFCLFDIDETPRTVGLVEVEGMITGAYTVFSVNQNIALPKYIYYFYVWVDNIKGLRPYYSGLRKTVRSDKFLMLYIPLPPFVEQEKVVSYLEDKTSKIDEVILAKEKQIKLLQEMKDVEIANVITRGLNPDVKMKKYDSLLSSECPEHWCITRNKSFMSLVGEKVGRQSVSYTLLSLTTKGVIIRDVESGKGKFPKDFDTYQIVQRGELVFCLFDIDETPRTVGIVETGGMVTGAYTVLRVNEKYAIPAYVYYYYLCVDNIKALKPYYSGLRKTVRADKFLQLYIPVPSVEEQRTIIAYIENKNNKIEALVKNLETEIAYLKEYKQKLIADCVTGQINVQCEQ